MRPMRRIRQHLVEQAADRLHDIDIGPLGVAADIVALPHASFVQDHEQSASVVLDVEPVTDIVALPVDGDRLAVQRF